MAWLCLLTLTLSACANPAKPARSGAPLLQLAAPAGYAYASVILIGDPSASEELAWADGKARLTVPQTGIVRLKSLGLVGSGGVEAQLDGKDYWRVGAATLGGARVTMFRFAEARSEPAIDMLLESELAQYVAERERAPSADSSAHP